MTFKYLGDYHIIIKEGFCGFSLTKVGPRIEERERFRLSVKWKSIKELACKVVSWFVNGVVLAEV